MWRAHTPATAPTGTRLALAICGVFYRKLAAVARVSLALVIPGLVVAAARVSARVVLSRLIVAAARVSARVVFPRLRVAAARVSARVVWRRFIVAAARVSARVLTLSQRRPNACCYQCCNKGNSESANHGFLSPGCARTRSLLARSFWITFGIDICAGQVFVTGEWPGSWASR
jgi:hypothetical protein